MAMPSMPSTFYSQPAPLGQMIETVWPASRSAPASCHTRRSNGDGRFSTRMSTRLDSIVFQVAPLDEHGHEPSRAFGAAADPQRRRIARQRLPVHALEPVPGILVARAVAVA